MSAAHRAPDSRGEGTQSRRQAARRHRTSEWRLQDGTPQFSGSRTMWCVPCTSDWGWECVGGVTGSPEVDDEALPCGRPDETTGAPETLPVDTHLRGVVRAIFWLVRALRAVAVASNARSGQHTELGGAAAEEVSSLCAQSRPQTARRRARNGRAHLELVPELIERDQQQQVARGDLERPARALEWGELGLFLVLAKPTGRDGEGAITRAGATAAAPQASWQARGPGGGI